jgi:hypothetical protein
MGNQHCSDLGKVIYPKFDEILRFFESINHQTGGFATNTSMETKCVMDLPSVHQMKSNRITMISCIPSRRIIKKSDLS